MPWCRASRWRGRGSTSAARSASTLPLGWIPQDSATTGPPCVMNSLTRISGKFRQASQTARDPVAAWVTTGRTISTAQWAFWPEQPWATVFLRRIRISLGVGCALSSNTSTGNRNMMRRPSFPLRWARAGTSLIGNLWRRRSGSTASPRTICSETCFLI